MIIVAVGGAAGFSWQRYELKTKFPDVKGLKSGAVVRVAGVEVGKVGERRPSPVRKSRWFCEVKKGNEQRITSDSRASIGSLSLLGEPVIDISPAVDRDAAQGRRLHSCRPCARTAGGRRRRGARVARADHRDAQGHPGGQEARSASSSATTSSTRKSRPSCRPPKAWRHTCAMARGTLGRLIKDPAAYERLERLAREPAGDHPAHQRRGGQPRPAAQGRCAGASR